MYPFFTGLTAMFFKLHLAFLTVSFLNADCQVDCMYVV